MDHKTAGLYIQLAKTLNALEKAGELPSQPVYGISAGVELDEESGRWRVVQST